MINVLVKKQSGYPVSTPKLKKILKNFLKLQGIVSDAEVSLSLVGEKKAAELAKKYLKETGVIHNVLSFPFNDDGGGFVDAPDDVLRLGDIVVCYPKLVAEAKDEGMLIDEKIKELVEHGAMHLLGKHHE